MLQKYFLYNTKPIFQNPSNVYELFINSFVYKYIIEKKIDLTSKFKMNDIIQQGNVEWKKIKNSKDIESIVLRNYNIDISNNIVVPTVTSSSQINPINSSTVQSQQTLHN